MDRRNCAKNEDKYINKYFPIILGGSLVAKESVQLFIYLHAYSTVQRPIIKLAPQ
jgi:hypothetical protein